MQTDQATYILRYLLEHSPPYISPWDKEFTEQRLRLIKDLLREFTRALGRSEYAKARDKISKAYRALGAEPPACVLNDFQQATHPVLQVLERENHKATEDAWWALFEQWPDPARRDDPEQPAEQVGDPCPRCGFAEGEVRVLVMGRQDMQNPRPFMERGPISDLSALGLGPEDLCPICGGIAPFRIIDEPGEAEFVGEKGICG